MQESGRDDRSEYYGPQETGGSKERATRLPRCLFIRASPARAHRGEMAVGPEAAQLFAARALAC
eukprot:1200611-Heterocapsa_arctica.AAC.1